MRLRDLFTKTYGELASLMRVKAGWGFVGSVPTGVRGTKPYASLVRERSRNVLISESWMVIEGVVVGLGRMEGVCWEFSVPVVGLRIGEIVKEC